MGKNVDFRVLGCFFVVGGVLGLCGSGARRGFSKIGNSYGIQTVIIGDGGGLLCIEQT